MLVPTSQELEQTIQKILEGVGDDERQAWFDHPVTTALSTFFETIRMRSFETLELGADSLAASALVGQARLCSDLYTFVNDVRKTDETEEPDFHDPLD